jgi:hypothetical protein
VRGRNERFMDEDLRLIIACIKQGRLFEEEIFLQVRIPFHYGGLITEEDQRRNLRTIVWNTIQPSIHSTIKVSYKVLLGLYMKGESGDGIRFAK